MSFNPARGDPSVGKGQATYGCSVLMDTCEQCINECDPNLCQNGGSCVDGIGSFSCNCVFAVLTCETEPTVPSNINDVACGTMIRNAWSVDSATYHSNKECAVTPWLCALTGKGWDKQATGLIKQTTGDCIAQREADPICIVVMMDVSVGLDICTATCPCGRCSLSCTHWPAHHISDSRWPRTSTRSPVVLRFKMRGQSIQRLTFSTTIAHC